MATKSDVIIAQRNVDAARAELQKTKDSYAATENYRDTARKLVKRGIKELQRTNDQVQLADECSPAQVDAMRQESAALGFDISSKENTQPKTRGTNSMYWIDLGHHIVHLKPMEKEDD